MANSTAAHDSKPSWSAEVLRVTAIPLAETLVSADWWTSVVGREAETKTHAQGLEQYIGALDGIVMLMRIVPGQQNRRIDWVSLAS